MIETMKRTSEPAALIIVWYGSLLNIKRHLHQTNKVGEEHSVARNAIGAPSYICFAMDGGWIVLLKICEQISWFSLPPGSNHHLLSHFIFNELDSNDPRQVACGTTDHHKLQANVRISANWKTMEEVKSKKIEEEVKIITDRNAR